jgi:hypothetical protein
MNQYEYYTEFTKLPPLPEHLVQEALQCIEDEDNITKLDYVMGTDTPSKSFPIIGDHRRLTGYDGLTPVKGAVYKRYNPTQNLIDWVRQNIHPSTGGFIGNIGVQVFRHSYPGEVTTSAPHIDGPRGSFVINYILKTGGDVKTQWFIENGKPFIRLDDHAKGLYIKTFKGLDKVHEVQIPERKWHSLEIRAIHTIDNLTSDRVALSIGLRPEWFEDLKSREQR